MRIRFAECVFDSGARQVVREGQPLPLSPKALQLLGALLLNRPRALARRDLCDLLWPSTSVSYASLGRTVNELRKAIGDDAKAPRFVRTVHGFGYAFCGPAADARGKLEPVGSFACGILWGGREIGLAEGDNLVGRAADCHVRIDSPRISRHHACIHVAEAGALIEDLGSKNGTYVRERRAEGPIRLADGDEICVGSAVLIFRAGGSLGSTETERRASR
jgi:DNA-binding winged helix-turn-helix (wHTH) protein